MKWGKDGASRQVAIIGRYENTDRKPQLRMYIVSDGNKKHVQKRRDRTHIKGLIVKMVDNHART